MPETSVVYDTPANFTFDPTKIEISGGLARLLPEPVTVVALEPFSNSAGHVLSAGAEIVGGLVRSKAQTAATELFRALYSAAPSFDAEFALGSKVGTGTGSPVVTAGKLDLRGGTKKFVDYPAASNAPSGNTGCIEFDLTPDYSGAPVGATQFFVSIGTEGSAPNFVAVHHDATSGNLRIAMNDSAGASKTVILGAWTTNVAGTTYRFSLNFDTNSGVAARRLFIGGAQFGTTNTTAFTRSGSGTIVRLGNSAFVAGGSASFASKFQIDNVRIFSTVQRTVNYTPAAVGDVYIEATDTLPVVTHSGVGPILSLDAFAATEGGTPRYTIGVDGGSFMYWTGSAWAVSDGTFAQSSTAANVNANLGTLPGANGAGTIERRVHFPAGNVQASVDLLSTDYTAEVGYWTDDPTIVTNSGVETDGLESFSSVEAAVGSDAVGWIACVSAVDYWFDGAAWATSDGSFAESNTAAEVETNKAALDLTAGFVLKWKAVLHSDDGTTRPSVTSHAYGYSFAAPTASPPAECSVYGYHRDALGNPIEGAVVRLRSSGFTHGQSSISKRDVSVQTDAVGYWELAAVETATISLSPYTLDVDGTFYDGLQVPNQISIEVGDLVAP